MACVRLSPLVSSSFLRFGICHEKIRRAKCVDQLLYGIFHLALFRAAIGHQLNNPLGEACIQRIHRGSEFVNAVVMPIRGSKALVALNPGVKRYR